MSGRDIGVILVWIGAIGLMVVMWHRIRNGAWSEIAFDEIPPFRAWVRPMAAASLVIAFLGALVVAWSLL